MISAAPTAAAPTAAATAALVATLGAVYVVSLFLRNSIGVIAPDLASDIGLTGGDLALISSIFFFAFVAMQIPVGVAIDRYGPKRCILAGVVATVISALLFAAAASFPAMIAARALMGLGTSGFLMAPLALYARLYPPDRFSALTGLQLAVGSIGGLLATAPLAAAVAAIGWRASFAIMAGATAAVGALVAIVVRSPAPRRSSGADGSATESEGESAHPAPGAERLIDSVRGVAAAWRCPDTGRLFVLNLTAYGSFVLVIGLWGGPYLTHVYGYSLAERGAFLFAAALSQAVGMFVWGSAYQLFRSYKLPVFLGGGSTAALLLAIGLAGPLPRGALWAWFAAFGFCAAFLPVAIAHGRALFPNRLVGRGITLLNLGTMGGGFVSQVLSGVVIEQFPVDSGAYPLAAYQAIFLMQAAFAIAGLIAYRGAREPSA